jgi:3-oxoadipate enol-lactonase
MSKGITLHYTRRGAGRAAPLLFINSLGTSHITWEPTAQILAASWQVVCHDKRGHGLSDCPPGPYSLDDHARDLLGLMDGLGIDHAILCGVSIGAHIAMVAAAARPERVRALVLCDTAAQVGTPAMWHERMANLQRDGMGIHVEEIAGRWVAPGFAAREPAAFRGLCNMLGRQPVAGYVASCAAIRDADARPLAARLRMPTLLLGGSLDQATPPDKVEALARLLPAATYRPVAGAGHLPGFERPRATAGLIADFLAGLAPA